VNRQLSDHDGVYVAELYLMTTSNHLRIEEVLGLAIANIPKPVRMRAVSSLEGFQRAEALFDIDLEMSSFRAITAQEEAAAALFRALQLRKYPGADRLDLKRHDHKAALWPVLDAARMAIGEAFRDIEFSISADPPKIRVGLKLAKYVENLPDKLADAHLELVHPLDVLSSAEGKPIDFAKQIQSIVELHNENSIRDHIRSMANSRNKILYASDQSMAKSRATREAIAQRKTQSLTALCICVGLLQTHHLQNYALQALDCFLRILAKADGIVMPYAESK
jgi:hypothetical protein